MENETVKELGKFFVDIAKLTFGGILLTTFLKFDQITKPSLIVFAIFVIVILASLGFLFINQGNLNTKKQ